MVDARQGKKRRRGLKGKEQQQQHQRDKQKSPEGNPSHGNERGGDEGNKTANDDKKNSFPSRRQSSLPPPSLTTTLPAASAATAPLPASYSNQHNSLLIQYSEDERTWYHVGKSLKGRDDTILTHPPPVVISSQSQNRHRSAVAASAGPAGHLVVKYRSWADSIYRRELELFHQIKKQSEKDSDEKWVESTMKNGTLKDRVAAMSVVANSNPIHKLYALDGLLQMAGCNLSAAAVGPGGAPTKTSAKSTNSRVARMAAEALLELFMSTFLPQDRRLLTMAQRPLYLYETTAGPSGDSKKNQQKQKQQQQPSAENLLSPRILLLWRFEELIKEKYNLFLYHYLGHTLSLGLEQDRIFAIRCAASLLRNVPEGEAAVLQLLVNKFGDPTSVKVASGAVNELRRVLEQHPAMQRVIAREVQNLAYRPNLSSNALYSCINFLSQLKLKREDTTTLSDKDTNDTEIQSEKKGIASSSQSLPASLVSTYFRLFEVAVKVDKKDKPQEASQKARLLSALLTGVNRAHRYLPSKDQEMDEHIDALYRVTHTSLPMASTQAFLLLFHVAVGSAHDMVDGDDDEEGETNFNEKESRDRPHQQKRQDRFYRALYETLKRPEMLNGGKHLTTFFNLLYKAMKYDTESNRVIAFCKRILSMTLHNYNSAICAASLFLLSEITKYHPLLRPCIHELLRGPDALRVLDATKREPKGALIVYGEELGKGTAAAEAAATADQLLNVTPGEERKAPCWELALTVHHFHPSIIRFTKDMGEIQYNGDPLKDFALAPFLNKFAYRNPKSAAKLAGKGSQGVDEVKPSGIEKLMSRAELPVNHPSFINKTKLDAADEFFHRFFVERAKRDKIKGIVRNKKKEKGNNGSDDDDSEEEQHAFEAAEMDGGKFEDFEKNWGSDSEEEAFVNSLAEKIIEDSSDFKARDLDEEDPDMDGWDDLRSNDDDDDDDNSDDDSEEEEGAILKGKGSSDDIDDDDRKGKAARKTRDDDDDDDDENDAFMDNDDSDDDDDDAFDQEMVGFDESDEDEGDLLALAQDEEDDSDDDDDEQPRVKKSSSKKKTFESTFVSAQDVEALIEAKQKSSSAAKSSEKSRGKKKKRRKD